MNEVKNRKSAKSILITATLVLSAWIPNQSKADTVVFSFDPTRIYLSDQGSIYTMPIGKFLREFGLKSVGDHVTVPMSKKSLFLSHALDANHPNFPLAQTSRNIIFDYAGKITVFDGKYYFSMRNQSHSPSPSNVEHVWIVPEQEQQTLKETDLIVHNEYQMLAGIYGVPGGY